MADVLPAAPLDWHPWYRDKTFLLDSLNSDTHVLRLPVTPVRRFQRFELNAPIAGDRQLVLELTKRKAFGPAPFVGEPFFYRWYVATDQFGRSITSESRIVYPDPGWAFHCGGHL